MIADAKLSGAVLITGGAGFLGRGIMRRAQRENWPCKFVVYSRDEFKQAQAKKKYDADYVLGDIRDVDRLSLALRRCDYVIHAAALKYVPESEFNVNEAIGINVAGTQAVIEAIRLAGVERAVLISTDKAVEPINTYGLTKALAERVFYEASRLLEDHYLTTVRYGNVIGSTGSVVPVFADQMERFGKLTVTDPTMTRFWIDIEDAIDLILYALNKEDNDAFSGTTIIPEPMSLEIGELAKALFGDDVAMDEVGMRPGEKPHESLITAGEAAKTWLPDSDKCPSVYYHYHPGAEAHTSDIDVRLNSVAAERMPREMFVRAVYDAERV